MKPTLLFSFTLIAQALIAQTFGLFSPTPPFDNVESGSVAFSDVDGDNDLDVLITGNLNDNDFNAIADLYLNDGTGEFTVDLGAPFEAVDKSAVTFADVDGDDDEDVLITGVNNIGQNIAKLYLNDGLGNFMEVTGTPFVGVRYSTATFADVDGDNDQDVIITGATGSGRVTELYTNDGIGNFTKVSDTPFAGVSFGSVAFSDVDGDNDQDVLITGFYLSNPSLLIAILYSNDGLGNFTELTNTPFAGVSSSSVAFSDVDGDGDEDLLITGGDNSLNRITKLYTNDGLGVFTEVMDTQLDGVVGSSVAFADVDGDNDPDLLLTGRDTSGVSIAKLYANDGMGVFTEVMGIPFVGVRNSSIAFADVDGDNDPDLLITGLDNDFNPNTKLYENTTVVSSSGEPQPNDKVGMIYPNPSLDGMVNFEFTAKKSAELQISLFDASGKMVFDKNAFAHKGLNTVPLDCSAIASGVYFVKLDDGSHSVTQEFIIQN